MSVLTTAERQYEVGFLGRPTTIKSGQPLLWMGFVRSKIPNGFSGPMAPKRRGSRLVAKTG